jgi:DNA-binding PadR family transcriptional regulator
MSEVLGVFEQAVLVAIFRLQKNAYGRAILKELEAILDRRITAGAVYATLDRLEAKGLTASRLGEGTPQRGGKAKRYYSLEAAGIRALNDSRAATQNVWRGLPWPLKSRP